MSALCLSTMAEAILLPLTEQGVGPTHPPHSLPVNTAWPSPALLATPGLPLDQGVSGLEDLGQEDSGQEDLGQEDSGLEDSVLGSL